MIVGGYVLHLYCEYGCQRGAPVEIAGSFYGNLRETVATAKKMGWRIDDTHDRALCPDCKRKGWPIEKAPA